MNFDFPDELKQLRDEARRFLTERCPTSVPRRILEGPEPYDRALWQAMAEMGWTGAAIPEEFGGAGLGHLAVCVLAEELGHAVAPVPFASSVYLATEAIQLFGSDAQKRRYLPKLAAGEAIGTLAMAESPARSIRRKLATHVATASSPAPNLRSRTAMSPISPSWRRARIGRRASPSSISHGPGVAREAVTTIDPTRSHARIVFDGAPADPLPGSEGADAVRHLLDRAAVMLAFEQVGCAQAALEMARDYARERYAFGRPIGSFQAIKHKLADIYIAVELARSNAYYGAWALHTDAAELPIAASVARISACDAGWLASKENIQTHGGMGFTWQMDCQFYYRRAKLHALALGGTREWKRRLIAELRKSNTIALPTD